MSDGVKLKPCPFCGEAGDKIEFQEIQISDPIVYAVCQKCHGIGPSSNSRAGAGKLWDTRAMEVCEHDLFEHVKDIRCDWATSEYHDDEVGGSIHPFALRVDDTVTGRNLFKILGDRNSELMAKGVCWAMRVMISKFLGVSGSQMFEVEFDRKLTHDDLPEKES